MDADLFEAAFKIMAALLVFAGLLAGGLLVLVLEWWRNK